MNIAITFRHLESTEAIKDYAREKVGKLQKFLRKPLKANVTLSFEKGEQMSEVLVDAGSEHYTAKERSDNLYASLDRVCDKLRMQIQAANGSKIAAKRSAVRAAELVEGGESLAAAKL